MGTDEIRLISEVETANSEKKPRVAIIILNWNGWLDTIECLESVFQMKYPYYDVIVVDNGSENNSLEKIKEYLGGKIQVGSQLIRYTRDNKPIKYIEFTQREVESSNKFGEDISEVSPGKRTIIIKNEKNYGFAEGNNIAIRYVLNNQKQKYILILNNDTVVDKSLLDNLVFHAESDEMIGFIGPKTYYYDYHGRSDIINFAGGRLDVMRGNSYPIGFQEVDKGQYDRITTVDYVEGSCFLARKEVFEKIGYFDKYFFTYWEETDLCMRARNAGYRLVYMPGAKIWHKVASSSKGKVKSFYFIRNRIIFVKRYATHFQLFCFFLYFFGFDIFFQSGKSLIYHRDFYEFILFLKGVYAGMSNLV
ncbi:MAG: glycosyltransferase family 2 protein [Methanoregulaceae archaeon]